MLHQELKRIVSELRQLTAETTWVEFKPNNAAPEVIGEYVSALAMRQTQGGTDPAVISTTSAAAGVIPTVVRRRHRC
ncbi:hypothetical protein QI633_24630 [Nocardioides sp. QY071]|uniref:hypothetical protein n=1 Tax=Nocardioides sp. QY071 TaxID=3044187 RepID=UPI00249C48BF|nr:hypothetical protein [Nocardioides sp. QY071]WGY01708.1 hypothetical protein QI633_24630 [Nocardioides sp. QY071]